MNNKLNLGSCEIIACRERERKNERLQIHTRGSSHAAIIDEESVQNSIIISLVRVSIEKYSLFFNDDKLSYSYFTT
jgi:hypothetical protein